MSAYVPRRSLICLYRDGRRTRRLIRSSPARSAPVTAPLQAPLQNRTALFNIALIFCLSMLFSKNSGNSFPDPFEKNTSQHPQHCPIPRAALNDHSPFPIRRRIKRVIFNIAHFCALSNLFQKFFRFFFQSKARPSSPHQFAFRIDFEENTGSQVNRHHIKYTHFPLLSSPKPKISQKNPIKSLNLAPKKQ